VTEEQQPVARPRRSVGDWIRLGLLVVALVFGVLFVATAGHRVWPWADDLVFWGMNLGVAAFIAVLLVDARDLERFTAPVMGAAVLLAIATFTLRLLAGRPAVTAPLPA